MTQVVVLDKLGTFLVINALEINAKEFIKNLQDAIEIEEFKIEFSHFVETAMMTYKTPETKEEGAKKEINIEKKIDNLIQKYGEFLDTQKDKNKTKEINQKIDELKSKSVDSSKILKTQLYSLKKGHCFGFAITHAIFNLTNESDLEKWERQLLAIANWNEEYGTLSEIKTILEKSERELIPDILSDKKSTESLPLQILDEKESLPLQKIMENALNYILFNHASSKEGFQDIFPKGINQSCIMKPDAHKNTLPESKTDSKSKPEVEIIKSFFECTNLDKTDGKYKIKTIKKRTCFSGCFTKEMLTQLLDEKNFSDTICLLHSLGHTICASYKNTAWILYDPNYDHTSLAKFHKKGSKEEIATEIIKILRNSIAIEISSLQEDKIINTQIYESLVKNFSTQLLKENGLFQLIMYNSETLIHILEIAESKDQVELRKAIANALVKIDRNSNTGFMEIVKQVKLAIPILFKLIVSKENEEIREALSQALIKKNRWGDSGLDCLIDNSPDALFEIFRLIQSSGLSGSKSIIAIQNIINDYLNQKDNCGNVKFFKLLKNSNIITELFKLAEDKNQDTLRKNIIIAFNQVSKYEGIGFLNLLKKANESLQALFHLAEIDGNVSKSITDILLKLDAFNAPIVCTFLNNEKSFLELIKFAEIKDHHEMRKSIIIGLTQIDNYGQTGLALIINKFPEYFSKVCNLVGTDEPLCANIIDTLLKENKWELSLFSTLLKNTTALKELIDFVDRNNINDWKKKITTSLFNPHRFWSLGIINVIKNSPVSLPKFYRWIELNRDFASPIIDMLKRTDKWGFTSFYQLLKKSPETLSFLFQLAEANEEIKNTISELLIKPDVYKATGISRIAKNPELLSGVFKCFFPELIEYIKNHDNADLQNDIASAFKFAIQTENGLTDVMQILAKRYQDGLTGWDLINKFAPNHKIKIVKVIVEKLTKLSRDQLIKYSDNLNCTFFADKSLMNPGRSVRSEGSAQQATTSSSARIAHAP